MADQTALEKIKAWIATYPDYSDLLQFQVDYTDQVPANGGIFPAGRQVLRRHRDILGDAWTENQLNFALYFVFEKASGDDFLASSNQEWITAFQEWVEEQSIKMLAPTFGDEPFKENITASNGALYDATDEGIGIYMIQLSIQYIKRY
ncbi:MAG: hypothetical protein KBS75_09360 [Bacteroidales bacterium]|nr:hypothetical protein [Candidatus Equimonas faecalis]